MPDDSGKLIPADVPIIQAFMARVSPDNCLTCPVTGNRIPLTQWQISDRLVMMPNSGTHLKADADYTTPVLSCMSPAGGMVLLSAVHMGLLVKAPTH